MLRFETKPDEAFTEIVTLSLELVVGQVEADDLNDEEALAGYGDLREMFSRPQLATELGKLLVAHLSPLVYEPTEYLWLILYHALSDAVDLHNDMVASDGPQPVGHLRLGPIDFSAVMEIFFWDEDFLLAADSFNNLSRAQKDSPGFGEGLFGVVNRIPPPPR